MLSVIKSIQPVLMSRDVDASVAFYRRLGFALAFQDTTGSPRYAVVARDGCDLHLQWQHSSQWEHPHDRPTDRFVVDDVDQLFQEFQLAGALPAASLPGSPWAHPGDTPWATREFHVLDPDGNGLQFYRPV